MDLSQFKIWTDEEFERAFPSTAKLKQTQRRGTGGHRRRKDCGGGR